MQASLDYACSSANLHKLTLLAVLSVIAFIVYNLYNFDVLCCNMTCPICTQRNKAVQCLNQIQHLHYCWSLNS